MGKTAHKASSGRDPGGFIALPWTVVDSQAFRKLRHPARSLLIDIARQYAGGNNGRLLTSMKHLSKRGWKSSDVVSRAKQELLAAGLIHETVKGHRPNKASWYAVTWQTLDWNKDYDYGAQETFKRGSYRDPLRVVIPTPCVPKKPRPGGGSIVGTKETESLDRLTA